ncbi:hypothetical protein PC116_g28597 [Phytophthora cactorum]|nr:hypothetical protein PC116_g28597 [Phytophthora cactorum]
MPFPSPPSYLKLHMPSVFSFQKACVAECMPLRPTCGFPSVAVGAFPLPSLVLMRGLSAFTSLPPLGLLSADVGTRCCTIVLLTTNLCAGVCDPEGVDSDITARRIEFYSL